VAPQCSAASGADKLHRVLKQRDARVALRWLLVVQLVAAALSKRVQELGADWLVVAQVLGLPERFLSLVLAALRWSGPVLFTEGQRHPQVMPSWL
jgi:hypothetical protein